MFAYFILVCAALSSLSYLYYTQFSKSRGGANSFHAALPLSATKWLTIGIFALAWRPSYRNSRCAKSIT